MKLFLRIASTWLLTRVWTARCASISSPDSASNPSRIWDTSSAASFSDNHVLGNGRVGIAVPGTATSENIQLNDNSLYSGSWYNRVNQDGLSTVRQMQSLIADGAVIEAGNIAQYGYVGTPNAMPNYSPLGYLTLSMNQSSDFSDYERWLDLSDGTAGVYYTDSGVTVEREYLASHPADIIAIRVRASQPVLSFNVQLTRNQMFAFSLNSWLNFNQHIGNDTIVFTGSNIGNGTDFAAGAKIAANSGQVYAIGNQVFVQNTDDAVIYLTAWTAYRKADPYEAVLADLKALDASQYDSIRKAHVADYSSYMSRVFLDLGKSTDTQRSMTTPQRALNLNSTWDPELVALLYFQFGRHLVVSTSRSGPQPLPPNLQGLWSYDIDPDWGGRYTIDINLQMNYWPTLVTNLADLSEPLWNIMKTIRQKGALVAQQMFNCGGWMCHHNSNAYGDCAPEDVDDEATYWPMNGVWLVTWIMEYYRFTGETAILSELYDLIEGSVIFSMDFLTDWHGYKVTNPSLSPENSYVVPNTTGESTGITLAPTIDNAMLWELFGMMEEIQHILDKPVSSYVAKLKEYRAQLPPLRVSQYGGIAEWIEDYTENEPGNRHWSPLWPLYPGSQITASNSTLLSAAHTTITRRLANGGASTGWSRAWSIALSARTFDPSLVQSNLIQQVASFTYNDSMLDTGPPAPFQVDGNYGATAAIPEALLQSQENVKTAGSKVNNTTAPSYRNSSGLQPAYTGDLHKVPLIRLLPAVPPEWWTNGGGSVSGLRARGGFQVDIAWSSTGKLVDANVTSLIGGSAYVTLGSAPIGSTNATRISVSGQPAGAFVLMSSEKGRTYTVRPA